MHKFDPNKFTTDVVREHKKIFVLGFQIKYGISEILSQILKTGSGRPK